MKSKKKVLIPIMILILVIGAVGGTLAWLTDQTVTVENTFTVGDVDIDLTENGAIVDPDNDQLFTQDFKMVPGADIDKKPEVTVNPGSEKCWVFVEVTESSVLADYISYSIDSATWTPIEENSNVYYYEQDAIPATGSSVVKSVLTGDKVTVKSNVTKEDMEALNEEGAIQPTLAFKAYAVQYDNLKDAEGKDVNTAAEVWHTILGK